MGVRKLVKSALILNSAINIYDFQLSKFNANELQCSYRRLIKFKYNAINVGNLLKEGLRLELIRRRKIITINNPRNIDAGLNKPFVPESPAFQIGQQIRSVCY